MTEQEKDKKGEEACREYYQGLHAKCGEILEASLSGDSEDLHAKAHSFIADISVWIEVIKERPEANVLEGALKEYQFAMMALTFGNYRQAFMGLRLFLELSLATIYFAAHEVELRLWQRGERDINWQTLINENSGVLSVPFVRAFFEGLADESRSYRTMAERAYRECSEFVHGNAHTHTRLPDSLEYDLELFETWHRTAESIRSLVLFALSARYLNGMEESKIKKIENVLIDELGDIQSIRFLLGGATEAS